MIQLKTPAEIEAMRPAGALVAIALAAVRNAIKPGVSTFDLDLIAADAIRDGGGRPAFLGYHPRWAPNPYPGVLCTSVNENIVHAIPDQIALAEGDLVSIDCGAFVDGWCGDAAFSVVVGRDGILQPGIGDPAVDAIRSGRELLDLQLIQTTEASLAAGIAAAQVGGRMGDIGEAIEKVARSAGFGLLEDHGGHGVGRSMHEDPHVPNQGRRRRGLKLKAGLVIAVEPMLQAGGRSDYVHLDDGWGLRTADGSRAAHAEHTIAITPDGPVVLTAE